ncbi:MAG: PPC domain-containing DNA-binding protein, partial [Thermoplasmata archaeon]
MQEFGEGDRYVLRIDVGEDLFEEIAGLARRRGIRAGIVSEGIGLLSQATLGYWNGREYAPRELSGAYEIVSVQGSIAEEEGRPSVHLHAALAGPDQAVLGGHLMKGTVG